MIGCFVAAEKGVHVPAMFVLGDSLGDAGTNNYIPHCDVRANLTPYGVTFFHYPTGRFTNGRTTFDFLATYLGLPFSPPYLEPNANFSRGINFASSDCGLLDSTAADANILPMGQQVAQFENFSLSLMKTYPSGAAQAKSYLSKSLYCITIGTNDIGDYVLNETSQNITTPQQFVTLLLSTFDQYITRLYRAGARKFLVMNIPPLGCDPYFRFTNNGECSEAANKLYVEYNTGLKSHVAHLSQKLSRLTIITHKAYDYLWDMIQNGEAYGFTDTKSACCGSGSFNAEVLCGRTTPQNLFCNDTNAYVFWDRVHPTEKVYDLFAQQIWSGNSSVIYPFNLSTLVSGKKASGFYLSTNSVF
ncbi:hypothetical protein SUGI_0684620 [Cryptomeria japonica]|nr:hypothetical protein SUGI_0684620 [Cryptomeria japonica]